MPQYIEYRGQVRHQHGEYLPHLQVERGFYFVTFCLHDAIPSKNVGNLGRQRERDVDRLYRAGKLNSRRLRAINEDYLKKVDELLDAGVGCRMLARPEIARIVADAFEYFHRDRYDLDVWTIMPTHAHVSVQTRPGYWLSEVMHSWKSFTGNEINKVLGRQDEPVWQADYFDRLIRTREELGRVREYIWSNSQAAGLKEWDWQRQYGRRWKGDEPSIGRLGQCGADESKQWWDRHFLRGRATVQT